MSKPILQGKEITGDLTTALDSRFLNSIVLQGKLDEKKTDKLIVTIDRVEYHEAFKYETGVKESDVYFLFFKGTDKPLKLAKVNLRRLFGMHGTQGEAWKGKKIALGIEQDRRPDLGGIKGPCVRILNINVETGKTPEQDANEMLFGKGKK